MFDVFYLDLARSDSIALSTDSNELLRGSDLKLTVEFKLTSAFLDNIQCRYEINGISDTLGGYNRSAGLYLVGHRHPLRGRVSIVSITTFLMSNVQFEDQGTSFFCHMITIHMTSGIKKKTESTKQEINAVYGKYEFF